MSHSSSKCSRDKEPKLARNVFAMGLLQFSNYLIPLVTLPYLTRVLGTEAFGKVAYAQVLMSFFIVLTDYGFSWSATRKIAAQRDDYALVSRIFAATWIAQWLLVIVAAVLALLVILCAERLQPDASLYFVAFSMVIGNALFPVWFLQGLERFQLVAVLQLFSRILMLIPIFVFIKEPTDNILVLLFQGGGLALGGILALLWIWHMKLMRWNWPCWQSVISELREGLPLFGSRSAISLYTSFVPLVLGWAAGPVAVAYFSLADKLRNAAQSLLAPLSLVLFPRINYLIASDSQLAFRLIKRSTFVVILVGGGASSFLWWLADDLIVLLAGEDYRAAGAVLRWLALLPLITGLSNLFGVQIMLPHGMNRIFNTILIMASCLSVVAIWPMVNAFQEIGAAQTILAIEIFVSVCMAMILCRRGYLSRKKWAKNED